MTTSAPPHVANFRALDGLPAGDGRCVRPGLLFRSGHLHDATPEDVRALAGLGVRTVFDLRSADEAAQQPDVLPPGARYRRVGALQMLDDPTDDPIDLLDWEGFLRQTAQDAATLDRLEAFQHGVYPALVRRPEAFRALVHELLDHPGEPLLVHCTAGKDRTGVACAILLRLLGVPEPVIQQDYLASAGNLVAAHQAIRDRVHSSEASPRVRALVDYMLGVSVAQLDSAFAEIDACYGDFEGFAHGALDLDDGAAQALRDTCLCA